MSSFEQVWLMFHDAKAGLLHQDDKLVSHLQLFLCFFLFAFPGLGGWGSVLFVKELPFS
jgi:hypothetical protein